MTQETRDIIYNKKAEELNKDEVAFLNQLISKKWAGVNFWCISVFGILAGMLIPSIFSSSLIVALQDVLPVMTVIGGFLGLSMGTMFYMQAPTLKSLGLTCKDWKELKKSGRLKELKKVVKSYDASLKSELDNLYEQEAEIVAQIKTKQEEKENLISELVEVRKVKEQLTGTPRHYTQEEVEEMLKAEESLLIRAMERVKQTQEMLNAETDETTLDEMGNSIKNKDYLAKALEDCKDLNKELD